MHQGYPVVQRTKENLMLAIVAAVLFALSLLLQLIAVDLGILTPDLLNTAGFLCVALHLAGVGARSRSRR